MTQPGPQCHPSLPLTLKLPCSLPMLDSSPPHTSLLLTITHPRPHPIAPPRQLYPPLALKYPKLKVCLLARVIHNCLLPPLPSYMLHKRRNHMMDTLSRGNVIKLSSHTMQIIMLHLNGNQLAPSNQRDAAQVPTWYSKCFIVILISSIFCGSMCMNLFVCISLQLVL